MFDQRPFMKDYILYNTDRRTAATNEEEKTAIKLTTNSTYGKFVENLKKRTDIKLVTDEIKAQKLIAKPQCTDARIFDENLIGIELRKVEHIMNKPTFCGFCILELSKLCMYKFWYDYIKVHFPGEMSRLILTDTDSLIIQFTCENVYSSLLAAGIEYLDPSNYPTSHVMYNTINKAKLDKMKDENCGVPIDEIVAIRPKMYSITVCQKGPDGPIIKEKHVAKGIQRNVAYNLRHQQYKEQLFNPTVHRVDNNRLMSSKHQMYAVTVNKIGLSSNDDKRYILDDKISTLAYGHKRINTTLEPDEISTDNDIVVPAAEAPARLRNQIARLAETHCANDSMYTRRYKRPHYPDMPTPSPAPFMTPHASPCKQPRIIQTTASLQSPTTPVHGFTATWPTFGALDDDLAGGLGPEEATSTELVADGPSLNMATRELMAGERRLKARRDRQQRNLAKLPTNKAHGHIPVNRVHLGAQWPHIYWVI
jgi:hypothetical protein